MAMYATVLVIFLIALVVGFMASAMVGLLRDSDTLTATANGHRRWLPGVCLIPTGDRVLVVAGGLGVVSAAVSVPARPVAPVIEEPAEAHSDTAVEQVVLHEAVLENAEAVLEAAAVCAGQLDVERIVLAQPEHPELCAADSPGLEHTSSLERSPVA